MDKLDNPVQSDLTVGIYDPAKARTTLARCNSIGTSQQPNSVIEKLGSSMGESSRLPAVIEPVAAGTGLYFHSPASNSTINSDGGVSELQNLFNLATVACNVESSLRHRQLVKKRRTPRNVLWINGSRIANDHWSSQRLPAGTDIAKRQRIGHLNRLYSPPWIQKSVLESSAFTTFHSSSNRVILKFGSQQGAAGKMTCKMSCQPTGPANKFNRLSKGNRLTSACSTKLSKLPEGRLPGKDTRVQGFAKRILQFIGDRSIEEKFIREALGNNPDTSKALRLLLRQQKVNRFGDGGRGKAFLYVATPAGLRELEEFRDDTTTHEDSMLRPRPPHCQDDQSMLKEITSP